MSGEYDLFSLHFDTNSSLILIWFVEKKRICEIFHYSNFQKSRKSFCKAFCLYIKMDDMFSEQNFEG